MADIPSVEDTTFHGHILPGEDRRWDIGSPERWWRKAYIRDLIIGSVVGLDTSFTDTWKQYATFVVAASDSTSEGIAGADFVCNGTNDEEQIQAAIEATTPSGYRRVLLLEGTFYVSGGVMIPAANTVVEGQGIATVMKLTSGGRLFDMTDNDNFVLRNLAIDGDYDANSWAFSIVYAENSSYITVDNVTVYNANCNFISAGESSDLTISNCSFSHCRYTRLLDSWQWTTQGKNFLVYGNKCESDMYSYQLVYMNGWVPGDMPAAPEDFLVQNVLIANNEWYGSYGAYPDNGAGGIAGIENAYTVVIANNVCQWYNVGAIVTDCQNVSIADNSFSNGYNDAVIVYYGYLWNEGGGTRRISITGNSIADVSGDGIGVVGADIYPTLDEPDWREAEHMRIYATISGNTIHYANEGITCQDANDFLIVGNHFSECYTCGIELIGWWEASIVGNYFLDNGYPVGCWGDDYGEDSDGLYRYGTLIASNFFAENWWVDVMVQASHDIIISDNVFYESCTESDYAESPIVFDKAYGVDCKNCSIKNNTFRGGVLTTYAEHAISMEDGTTDIIIDGNDFRDFTYSISLINDEAGGAMYLDNLTDDAFMDQEHTLMESLAFMMG